MAQDDSLGCLLPLCNPPAQQFLKNNNKRDMTQLSPVENLFAVELPPDASDFRILNFSKPPTLSYDYSIIKGDGGCQQGLIAMIDLPPGSYEILFTTINCSEEQAAGVVEKEPGYYDTYREYERDGPWVNDIAVNSLHSLLRANGCSPETNYLLIKKIV